MITNDGKNVIREFFGGQTGAIGGWIAVGTGTTAEAVSDAALEAEVIRVVVSAVAPDLANNRIVFKAVLPASAMGDLNPAITEVALFHVGGEDARLVARTVLDAPKVADEDLPTEIEYSLTVTV